MPGVIVAVVEAVGSLIGSAAGAIGITLSSTTGSTLPVVPNLEDVLHDSHRGLEPTLEITGLLIPFGVCSSHLLHERPDGSEFQAGSITYFEHGVREHLMPLMPGIPIYAADKHTRIGFVTDAWIEDGGLHISGKVISTARVKFHLTEQDCGLCLQVRCDTPRTLRDGPIPPDTRPDRVFVTLPGQAAFEQNWVRFVDGTVKCPACVREFFPLTTW